MNPSTSQCGPDSVGPVSRSEVTAQQPLVSAWLTDLRFDWGDATQGARKKSISKGKPLFLEGQSTDAVYVIEEGRILLTSYSPDGKERHLMIVGPTGLVGDCAWLATRQHVVSAVAATDATVSVVPTAQMLISIEKHPLLQRQQQEMAGLRFRIMLQHLALQASNSARRRISHHLLGLMNSYGVPHQGGTVISIAFTQQEMGDICGLSRVSVSNTFSTLEREGILGRTGRLVLIRDAERLVRMATS
jgi:CRP/FNR family cyclic AMP-dependent transcriptional regulator